MEHSTPNTLFTQATEQKQTARWTIASGLRYVTRAGKHYVLRLPWRDYLQSLGLVALVSLAGQPFVPYLDHANLVMLYLLVEVVVATRFGREPSIMTAFASVIAFHFFFIVPHFTFFLNEVQYLLTFGGLLVSGLVISVLTARVREQAIERARLADQAHQAQFLREKEKLQSALLNSISHDLRTPMASITGVLSTLYDDEAFLNKATRRELVENAWEEANRMNRLIANLLDMTRLQAGAMKMVCELCDIQDLIGVALAELANKLAGRSVTVTVPPDLPLVSIDFVLMSRVIFNLLDNARKYSPSDAPIEVRAHVANNRVEIEVADRGLGIPPDEIARVFEMFYRVQYSHAVAGGTGLGLSICKGIVEAHGGQIRAEARPGGGVTITVALPLNSSKAEGLSLNKFHHSE